MDESSSPGPCSTQSGRPSIAELSFVLTCGACVICAAMVQIFLVLEIPRERATPFYFIVPLLVGCSFGTLLVIIRRLRNRERAYNTELATQKAEILELSQQLEERVHERGTELSVMETRLRRGQRLETLGRVASQVAHDVNNLLSIVLMSGWCLREEASRLQEHERAHLDEIVSAASRTATLMHRLLDFGRRGVGDAETIEPSACLAAVAELAKSVMGPDIRFDVVVADELPLIHVDRRRLEMVLLNLLINARDAIGSEPGRVLLSVNAEQDSLRFSVEDDGPGMSTALQERVLEPFYTTKRRGKGTGLGLSIASYFAREVGGELTIESELGEGTKVALMLPAAGESERALPEPPPLTQSLHLLLIEPDPILQRLIRRVLVRQGHTVLECADTGSADNALKNGNRVDLILADERTLSTERPQGFDGVEAILLCGADAPDGDQWFVRKPFDADQLVRAIAHATQPDQAHEAS